MKVTVFYFFIIPLWATRFHAVLVDGHAVQLFACEYIDSFSDSFVDRFVLSAEHIEQLAVHPQGQVDTVVDVFLDVLRDIGSQLGKFGECVQSVFDVSDESVRGWEGFCRLRAVDGQLEGGLA